MGWLVCGECSRLSACPIAGYDGNEGCAFLCGGVAGVNNILLLSAKTSTSYMDSWYANDFTATAPVVSGNHVISGYDSTVGRALYVNGVRKGTNGSVGRATTNTAANIGMVTYQTTGKTNGYLYTVGGPCLFLCIYY